MQLEKGGPVKTTTLDSVRKHWLLVGLVDMESWNMSLVHFSLSGRNTIIDHSHCQTWCIKDKKSHDVRLAAQKQTCLKKAEIAHRKEIHIS